MTQSDINHAVTVAFAGYAAARPGDDFAQPAQVLPAPLVDAITDGPGTLYAILDANRALFLPERLELAGLKGRMIYKSKPIPHGPEEGDDPLAAVSPWLIPLDADGQMLRDFFGADPDDNWHLMPARAGILLRSTLTASDLLDRFLALSQLPDDGGASVFFRFQEPGMLAALCATAPSAATAGILNGITAVIWTEDTVIDAKWQGHVLRPTPELHSDDPHTPVIDRDARRAFAAVINRRRARLILRESDIEPAQRSAIVEDLAHLLGVSQSSSDAMLHHLRLMESVPAADRPHWRQMVDQGDISLAFINRKMHDHYYPAEVFSK